MNKKKKKKKPMQTILETILNVFLAIILPVQLYLLLVGGFIALSTLLGILAARKEKEKISLLKLTNGIIHKMFVYTPTTLALFYLDAILLNEIMLQFVPVPNIVTKLGTLVILGKEFASINKNIEILTGKSFSDRCKEYFKTAIGLKKKYDELKKEGE